jgi:hypothetical protein
MKYINSKNHIFVVLAAGIQDELATITKDMSNFITINTTKYIFIE